MADNQSQNNPSAYFGVFKISLTREQQCALTDLLPRNYSFHAYKATRSLDDESIISQPHKVNKKKLNREQKDPDYSASYVAGPKEVPIVKVESSQAIPGGQPFMECYLILRKLKKSIFSWPFKIPVDPKTLGIPEYLNVVLQPMDLKTIEDNIRKQAYKHPGEFHRDIYKIMMNSYKFNQKNSQVFATTVQFQEEYLKVCKEAKQGKLVYQPDKKVKLEGGSMEEDTPTIVREKSSVEIKQTRPYHKKEKPVKIEEKQTDKEYPKEIKEASKEKERVKQKLKEKEIKEKEKEKEKEKQRQKERVMEKEREKMKQRERVREKEEREREREREREKERQREREKIKLEQQLRQIQRKPFSFSHLFDEEKDKNNDLMEFSEVFEPSLKRQLTGKEEKDDISITNDPSRKNKEKHHSDSHKIHRQKKNKQKNEFTESLKQIKQLKQVTIVQNEKGIVLNAIQRKLTDLLKKLNQYQLPKPKAKAPIKNNDGEHPNFNNFTNITASEKKKLAEKISLLPSSELKYVIQIYFRNKRERRRDQEGIYQFDLEKTDAKTLKQLSNFVAMRSKLIKKMPRPRNESSRVASSQMQAEIEPQDPFKYEVEDDQSQFHHVHYDSNHRDRHSGLGVELMLEHPDDNIHSQMFEQDFNFPAGELMQIDVDGNSDEYQPDEDNYHF